MRLNLDNFYHEIIEKHSDMVFRICLLYLKNYADAEDAYQEVFIKIIEKAPKFKDGNHEKAWIIRVTINHCKNILRRINHRKIVAFDENYIFLNENKKDKEILQIIFNLPLNYRKVIYLYYFEGYKTKDIAKILKKQDATIRTWLKRARESLKVMIGGCFNEED